MHPYSFGYSLGVVDRFCKSHTRGYTFFRAFYPRFTKNRIARVFQYHQTKWRVFKKVIKLMDRMKSDNQALENYYTSVNYFNAYENALNVLPGRKYLTRSELLGILEAHGKS